MGRKLSDAVFKVELLALKVRSNSKKNPNWAFFAEKKVFGHKSKFSNTIPYPGGYHKKAYVPRIPKMWYFLGLAVFKVELLAPEVGSKFKKNGGKAVSKKKVTATIF